MNKPCPFCGSRSQMLLPCEVQVEQADGSFVPEPWFGVVCECMVTTPAGRTAADAWANWNRRAA